MDSPTQLELRTTLRSLFHSGRLGTADCIGFTAVLAACFVFFLHPDIQSTGWYSLNYLFGSPLEFYENCKQGHGVFYGAYLPPIYAIFALWLYPAKLFGLLTGPETFPLYLSYWLKVLTTMAYVSSGFVVYRISLEYHSDKAWARYAAAAWLTAPLAVFSQFIFSQYDIFYVLPTLAGFWMFLRRRLYTAAALFSCAITIKYFPAFVFMPLLLLYEKRVLRLALCCLILMAPTLALNVVYDSSPAFIDGVRHYVLLDRIYEASVDIGYAGFWRVYLLPALFAILCGFAYFAEVPDAVRPRVAAYLFLAASILPFMLIFWHPQWLMFPTAAIALTTSISGDSRRFMLLDLAGMFFFVATTALTFQDNVDATMFRGWPDVPFTNAFPMARLFEWFDDHSRNVFLSAFWAYLALQILLKFRPLCGAPVATCSERIDYGCIRQRLYLGLGMFLVPALLSLSKSLPDTTMLWAGSARGGVMGYPILHSKYLEQTFVAKGSALKQVILLVSEEGEPKSDVISLDIIDGSGNTVLAIQKTVRISDEWAWRPWQEFSFEPLQMTRNAPYRLRLTSLYGTSEKAFVLVASSDNSYHDGQAIVNGVSQRWDFVFKLGFVR